MSGPTFYYAEVNFLLLLNIWPLQTLYFQPAKFISIMFQEPSEESAEGQEDLKRATAQPSISIQGDHLDHDQDVTTNPLHYEHQCDQET